MYTLKISNSDSSQYNLAASKKRSSYQSANLDIISCLPETKNNINLNKIFY